MAKQQPARTSLPCGVGLGLKHDQVPHLLQSPGPLRFVEVHAENYLVDGGPFHEDLMQVRARHALSMHGVGLSIGGDAPLDIGHLRALRALLDRYEPKAFSEHLAWSGHSGIFFNDLLPLAYTHDSLQRVCDHIDQTQAALGRRMLLENPATYLEFEDTEIDEASFITQVIRRTGCGLLLDVSNVHVSGVNHHRSVHDYLRALPLDQVGEIHLAGFSEQSDARGDPLLIDSHGCAVAPAVWALYAFALGLTGPVPTLIERDNDIPAWEVLLGEAAQAACMLDAVAQVPLCT